MKKIISVLIIALSATVAFAQQYRYTADWYKSNPAKYLDKVVTVKICAAKPSSFEAMKGYVSFHCWTAYNDERGGYIYVLVPSNKARAFGRDYGKPKAKSKVNGNASANIPTRDLRAKFVKVKWEGGAEEYVLMAD